MFATKRPQDGPRAAQDAAQEASRKHLEGVLEPGAAQEEGTPSDQGGYPIVPFSIWLQFGYILDDFSSFLAYFGHIFGCSCWGGYAPPDPPALALVSVVLGQVFSQRCQENPRTCRGQCRESKNLPRIKPRKKKIRTDAYKKTNISKLCSSKLLSLSQPSLLQKLWAAVLPPRGASIRRPTGNGVWDRGHQVFF